MHPITYHGLNRWFVEKFESLSWVLLSESTEKYHEYNECLNHLINSLELKYAEVMGDDEKFDLALLTEKSLILREFFNHCINMNLIEHNHIHDHDHKYDHDHMEIFCTCEHLEKWYKKSFKKMGWMVLAKHENNIESIECYMHGLHKLCSALKTKINQIHNPDKRRDLQIMHDNVIKLKMLLHKTILHHAMHHTMNTMHQERSMSSRSRLSPTRGRSRYDL